MDNDYNQKRINPPVWQHDYHVLKRLYGILKILSAKIPVNAFIVDYGCGTSPYMHLFQKKAKRFLKIDIGRNKNADISIKENQSLPLKNNSAEVVLSTQVLEHVNNLPLYLSEASRILKKNGFLLLSTHGIWPYHPSPFDYYRFTSIGLRKEVEKYGFRTLKFYSILGSFASISQFTLLLIAERFKDGHVFAKILLACISLIGNTLIWIEDKLAPSSNNSDAAVYLIWAVKK